MRAGERLATGSAASEDPSFARVIALLNCYDNKTKPVRYSGEKVANRTIRVWRGATENGPWTMNKSHAVAAYETAS